MQSFERVVRAHARFAAAPYELQALVEEFDFPYAAATDLEVTLRVATRFDASTREHGRQVVDDARVDGLSPDERRKSS
jgi:hypothetical protein